MAHLAVSDSGEMIQILTYIKRKPTLTPVQFYNHWENVHGPKVIPWAEKHGMVRYQQIHTSGTMLPSAASSSAPNASFEPLPAEPVEFDGIALFLVKSLDVFVAAFQDPYYVNVIEPDERDLIDKEGVGSGVVASFSGKMLGMVDAGRSSIGELGAREKKIWEEWEKKE